MKKLTLALVCALTLGACAGGSSMATTAGNVGSTATAMGKNLFGWWVQNQCVSELQSRNEWRLIALAMSAEKQAEWEGKICGCVSEEAPNQMTAADMTQLVSAEGRTKVISQVGVKTVSACFQRLYKGSSN